MKHLRVSENIVPVTGFKAKAAEMLRRLAISSEPLVITQNGKAAGAITGPSIALNVTVSRCLDLPPSPPA